jgi:hypothetical protein
MSVRDGSGGGEARSTQPSSESPSQGRSRWQVVVVLVVVLTALAAGFATARRIGIKVYKPAKMACQGTPIKVGVRAQGAARGFRIMISDPAKKKVFSKKGRAPKKWRYWKYSPVSAGVFKTEYRTALGKRRFTTNVSQCQAPVDPPVGGVGTSPVPPSPPPPSPPSPPPAPGCGSEVCLADNDAGSAMFTMNQMVPGDTEAGCVTVTYGGSIAAHVKLYGSTTGTGLDRYLDLQVSRGANFPTDPGFDSCANFVPDGTNYIGAGPGVVYSGTLQAFADSYATGLVDPIAGSPEVWSNPEHHVYKFEVTLQDTDAAQGLIVAQEFIWEARDA